MSKKVKLEDLRKGDYIQHNLGGAEYEVVKVDALGLQIKAPDQRTIYAGFSSLAHLGFVGYRATPKVKRGVIYRKLSHPAVVIFYEPPMPGNDTINWYSTVDGWMDENEVNDLLATGEYEALPKE